MAEFTYNPVQVVAPSSPVVLNTAIGCTKGYVLHRPESGIVTLRGIVNNPYACFARYNVEFNANIAVPEGETVQKKDVSPTELDRVGKAVDIIKDVDTIQAMGNYSYDDGYSEDSYRRGRSTTTGRYMSRDAYPMWGAGHGGNVSYASGTDYVNRSEMRDNLRRMLNTSQNEKERMAIQQLLDSMRRACRIDVTPPHKYPYRPVPTVCLSLGIFP